MIHKAPSRPGLNRRSFLKFLVAAGIATAGGYLLYESTPWLDYDQQVAFTRRPIGSGLAEFARKRELVRYATLAANGLRSGSSGRLRRLASVIR
jgi:hypothetical protein